MIFGARRLRLRDVTFVMLGQEVATDDGTGVADGD